MVQQYLASFTILFIDQYNKKNKIKQANNFIYMSNLKCSPDIFDQF